MYHIFFIHFSVDGHLGCFRVLAIVNSVAVNIGVQVSFRIMVFSGYMPRSGIATFAAIWMDLEIVILSEVSQTEKDKYMISLTCGI